MNTVNKAHSILLKYGCNCKSIMRVVYLYLFYSSYTHKSNLVATSRSDPEITVYSISQQLV